VPGCVPPMFAPHNFLFSWVQRQDVWCGRAVAKFNSGNWDLNGERLSQRDFLV